ncbi:MAG: tyrosine-type recombinase/integrase [Chloroflexi bacterium]|nr:tyrosine-type recombinase/integrase [Chloroflexota bacterium]
MSAATFAALLQSFFSDRLLRQMRASPNTVAGYRDAFRLLLRYASDRLGKEPSRLAIDDLDPALVTDFLDFLESERGNTARTRNNRLAAIRSFFRHVAMNEPAHALHCQRILAIPQKRHQKTAIEFLERSEIEALVAAPDPSTWIGRRDMTILLVLVQTGLRVSELTSLRREDVVLGASAYVRCEGKGRKQRCIPLRRDAVAAVAAWIDEQRSRPHEPLFPSSTGGRLSEDAAQRLVAKHARAAAITCKSIAEKNVTPHVLRHSCAMALREQGVDLSTIALWLGHESVETTQMYLHADIRLKERALALTDPIDGVTGRFKPDDDLMAFLESL